MITVDLYIRVSTDEQADRGYSQRHQEDILRKYCELKGYHIRRLYLEDHSAKNFDRPQFQKLLINFRKEKGIVNMLLFTKWDRFSRNAADAYAMIKELNKLGVEPFSIEQPIDVSIPENKIMLAFYLASPEVENDRRSLNVFTGMRKAMKEGRYMGKAPIGYINKRNEHKKWIEPDPATAPIIIDIFKEVALGKYSAESVLKFIRAKGVCCSKNNYWNLLRNPVYCGKIIIPAYKTEEQTIITGQHQPLISEALFYLVQNVLDGKKKIQKAKKAEDDRFPLRGFLQCPDNNCGRILTASASTGRHRKKYEYYHCISQCGHRIPAAQINDSIIKELCKWKPHPAIKVLYAHILQDVLGRNQEQQKEELKKIQKEMTALTNRHTKARELLMTDSIEPDDYKAIKKECDKSISILEAQVADITQAPADIRPQLDKGIDVLDNIEQLYSNANTITKRDIIGSIFPEKLIYDGTGFRTARVNEAVQLIFSLSAAFTVNKMGQLISSDQLSHEVIPVVPFSNHFLYDLRRLANLFSLLKAS